MNYTMIDMCRRLDLLEELLELEMPGTARMTESELAHLVAEKQVEQLELLDEMAAS